MMSDVRPSEARLRNSAAPGERYGKEQFISERNGNLQMVVEGGVLRQRFLSDGRCQTVAIYYHDDVVNLSPFMRQVVAEDHLLALRGTVMASVEPSVVDEIRKMSVSGIDGMEGLVLRELGIAQERMICIGQRTAVQSMAHFFCEALVRSQRPGSNRTENSCYLPLTQNAVGDILGLTPVHVNRTLQNLRSLHLADLNRFELTVFDFEKRAELAEFDESYLAPV